MTAITPKAFRFGAIEAFAASGQAWAQTARRAEDVGFSTLQIIDHFSPQLSPLPALMAAADATTTFRVGAQVFCNDYHHPAVLAKDCATLDVLSGGRLELGIGAGWMAADYRQTGIPFDDAKVRIDRLEESIQVLKQCFAGDPVHFAGTHYQFDGFTLVPTSVQRPHPPFLIGGGAKRMLRLAGREADIVGINFDLRSDAAAPRDEPTAGGGNVMSVQAARTGTAAEVDQKIQWVREGAGDRFHDLELNVTAYTCEVTGDATGRAEETAPQMGIDPEEFLAMPFVLLGTVDEMVDVLLQRRERWGLNYITLPMPLIAGGYDVIGPLVAELAGT